MLGLSSPNRDPKIVNFQSTVLNLCRCHRCSAGTARQAWPWSTRPAGRRSRRPPDRRLPTRSSIRSRTRSSCRAASDVSGRRPTPGIRLSSRAPRRAKPWCLPPALSRSLCRSAPRRVQQGAHRRHPGPGHHPDRPRSGRLPAEAARRIQDPRRPQVPKRALSPVVSPRLCSLEFSRCGVCLRRSCGWWWTRTPSGC